MRVLTPKAMADAEAKAYQAGSKEEAFMEQAGEGIAACAHHYMDKYGLDKHIYMLCGKGNNTGDAYVAGYLLLSAGYLVSAVQLVPIETCSPLCKKNYERFLKGGGKVRNTIDIPDNCLLLDGLFGTGFRGKLEDPFASAVEAVNHSGLPVIAIDIPSGLNGETGTIDGPCIHADQTLFLGLPKTGFFLNNGWNVVGSLESVDFGLPQPFIEQADSPFEMLTRVEMEQLLPPIVRNRHKYQAGHVVGLAGSFSMPGAALLASLAALRGGAGMLHLLHPPEMLGVLSASPPEVIKIPYRDPANALERLSTGKAAFVGPGLGRSEEARALLKQVIPNLPIPSVIDADALTLIAEEKIALPKNAILTPHRGEMERLLPGFEKDFLTDCQRYAEELKITLILKGAPTFIFHPNEKPRVNPTGCPGMATAGSGDVLTGLLSALLAQGLIPHHAASLGVYLHGLAGQHAEDALTPYCMIASDITEYFSEAFRFEEA